MLLLRSSAKDLCLLNTFIKIKIFKILKVTEIDKQTFNDMKNLYIDLRNNIEMNDSAFLFNSLFQIVKNEGK